MPTIVVKTPATMRTSHMEMWIPGLSPVVVEPKWKVISLNCSEASQPAVYAPAA